MTKSLLRFETGCAVWCVLGVHNKIESDFASENECLQKRQNNLTPRIPLLGNIDRDGKILFWSLLGQ